MRKEGDVKRRPARLRAEVRGGYCTERVLVIDHVDPRILLFLHFFQYALEILDPAPIP
jgi:hypothetical protein